MTLRKSPSSDIESMCVLHCFQVLVALAVPTLPSLPLRGLVVLVAAVTTPPLQLGLVAVWASEVQAPQVPLVTLAAPAARAAAMPWIPLHQLLASEAVLVA
jgi:hypothetical protein